MSQDPAAKRPPTTRMPARTTLSVDGDSSGSDGGGESGVAEGSIPPTHFMYEGSCSST